jgi:hypothetical protein
MLGDPRTIKGGFSWAFLGIGGAVVALLIAYLFPGVIPAQASAQKL